MRNTIRAGVIALAGGLAIACSPSKTKQPVETTTELWAFFRGEFVPLREANINVMTHGFNYGTAVFEGIRAYWNADEEQLYGLELVPHYERIHRSARLLMMEVRHSPQELAEITVELLRRDGLREDMYIRPIVYKSSETIGVRLHNLDADITIFAARFGILLLRSRSGCGFCSRCARITVEVLPANGGSPASIW